MINTPTPQRRMSIEEAVATALPVDGNNLDNEPVQAMINNMVRQGLQYISANPTTLSWRSEHPNLVIAQVDMDDYLRVQQELLDNPGQVQRYVEMLNPTARNFLEDRARERQRRFSERGRDEFGRLGAQWDAGTYEAVCIRSIFGIDEGTRFLIGLTSETSYEDFRRHPVVEFVREVQRRDNERDGADYVRIRESGDWSDYHGPEFCPHHFTGDRFQRHHLSDWEQEGNIEVSMMGQTQSPTGTNPERDRRMFNELRNFVDGLRRFEGVREITLLPGRNGVMASVYERG